MSSENDGEAPKPRKPRARAPGVGAVIAALVERERLVTDDSGTAYRYNGAYFDRLSEAALTQAALRADLPGRSSDKRRREIVSGIKAETFLLDLEWGRVAEDEVACKNGVVNVRTGAMRPHRPEDLLDRVIP